MLKEKICLDLECRCLLQEGGQEATEPSQLLFEDGNIVYLEKNSGYLTDNLIGEKREFRE